MSATDELRRLLDERGIEWRDGAASCTTEWQDESGAEWSAMEWAPTLSVLVSGRTPAQAVEMTLGRGKCRMERMPECSYDDLQCTECGCALWGFQIDMAGEGVITIPRFCPWCGREVEQ